MERYCANCRAELPGDASTCPACGVYAGDLFDERKARPRRGPHGGLLVLLLLAIAGGAASWWYVHRPQPQTTTETPPLPSTKVVRDRPGGARRASGATINEAEAVRILRRHLVATKGIRDECIAVISNGGSYLFTAVDSCQHTRLGRFRVDGKSGEVTLQSPNRG